MAALLWCGHKASLVPRFTAFFLLFSPQSEKVGKPGNEARMRLVEDGSLAMVYIWFVF